MPAIDRYHDALNNMPPPGHGQGCHPALLSAANLGALAGLEPEQIFSGIHRSIPQGNRRVSDREIWDAVTKAMQDYKNKSFIPQPQPTPIVQNGKIALQNLIDQGDISDEVDLWESSPRRLWSEVNKDPVFLLQLFKGDDLIWIGDRYEPGILEKNIRSAVSWIEHFQNGGQTAPHIILNPLTGTPAPKKSGDETTLRGDSNVKEFRYCLVEFDTLTREDQIRFWSVVKLPIVALIDTGGKSIHGWVDVQKLVRVKTSDQWETEVKSRLYDRILKPLGVDGACSNPARLSRLPGHFRQEKGAMQKILWLSREGREIHA